MTEVIATKSHDRHDKVSFATRRLRRRCAIGAVVLVVPVLPVTGLAAPAIGRADEPCAPGWVWSVDLNQCVFWLPTVNGPGGPGGLVAVSALSARQRRLQASSSSRWKPQHNASPAEMRHLIEGAGLVISDQHRIPRPAWTRIVSDLITVGTKS